MVQHARIAFLAPWMPDQESGMTECGAVRVSTGEATVEFVAAVIGRSNGRDHSMSPHHRAQSVTVHLIRREGWYIKFYFVDPETRFISVHQ